MKKEPWLILKEGKRALPKGYWNKKSNRREVFNFLKKEYNIKFNEDWYKILNLELFIKHGIKSLLLSKYKHSPIVFLKEYIPENKYRFLPWLFNSVPNGTWNDKNNIRGYFEWFCAEKKLDIPEGLYKLSWKDLMKNHGGGLIKNYKGSVKDAIIDVFPEYDFIPWKFTIVKNGFWKKKKNRRDYILWLFDEIGISFPIDADLIIKKDFNRNYGGGLITGYPSDGEFIINYDFNKYPDAIIQIINNLGQVVYYNKEIKIGNEYKINTNDLENGIYTLEIIHQNGAELSKLIIQ